MGSVSTSHDGTPQSVPKMALPECLCVLGFRIAGICSCHCHDIKHQSGRGYHADHCTGVIDYGACISPLPKLVTMVRFVTTVYAEPWIFSNDTASSAAEP